MAKVKTVKVLATDSEGVTLRVGDDVRVLLPDGSEGRPGYVESIDQTPCRADDSEEVFHAAITYTDVGTYQGGVHLCGELRRLASWEARTARREAQ